MSESPFVKSHASSLGARPTLAVTQPYITLIDRVQGKRIERAFTTVSRGTLTSL